MDLVVFSIFAIVVLLLSKDRYVEDRQPSISEVIRNLEKSKTIQLDDISAEDEQEVRGKFNLDFSEDSWSADIGDFKL